VAEPRKLNERIGLDYLFDPKTDQSQQRPQQQTQRPTLGPGLTHLAAFSVLQMLQRLEAKGPGEQGVHLREVGNEVRINATDLIPLTRALTDAGLIDVIEPDSFGDDLVRLSQRGNDLVRGGNPSDLFELLGESQS
jgi:hypothetical protein